MAPATSDEVSAVERLHQAAQARLGIAAAYVALAQWESVSATNAAGTSLGWLQISVRVILAVRKMSRRLAVEQYQLVRALETGHTLGVPIGLSTTPDEVPLGSLRTSFRNSALDIAAMPAERSRSADPDIRWFEDILAELNRDGKENNRLVRLEDAAVDPLVQDLLDVEGTTDNSTPIKVDDFNWDTDQSLDQVQKEMEDVLRNEAVKVSADKAKALRSNPDLTPDQAITQIEDAHDKAGSIGAGIVDAAGLRAGRDAIDKAIQKDRLIMAVARGTSSDPCAFCSMLASRGFTYRSEASAGFGDETIKQYHVNCHCFPIVRYLRESELPALNRYFQEKWPVVTAGHSGIDARNAWRRWIYAQRKANPDDPHGFVK
jgi:ElaB/YqjD/DUF883 family membrane-anchored ribosome-binding protein